MYASGRRESHVVNEIRKEILRHTPPINHYHMFLVTIKLIVVLDLNWRYHRRYICKCIQLHRRQTVPHVTSGTRHMTSREDGYKEKICLRTNGRGAITEKGFDVLDVLSQIWAQRSGFQ
jgi:hypothetical protein